MASTHTGCLWWGGGGGRQRAWCDAAARQFKKKAGVFPEAVKSVVFKNYLCIFYVFVMALV